MESIDRLGWAAGFSFRAFGLRIGVRATAPSLLAEVRRRLPPGATESRAKIVDRLYSFVTPKPAPRGVRGYHLLYADAARLARSLDPKEPLDAFEESLPPFVAGWSRGRIFLHAGVVGWRGRAIVLPGRTFTGKSTLVAALVRAGATYYSDEFAVLDGRGRVHPYARPLGLRDQALCSRPTPVESLGGRAGRKPLPVALVLLSRYRAGQRFRPRVLTPARGLLRLLPHTIPIRFRPAASLDALARAVGTASILEGARGEADETARALLALAS